MEQHELLKLLLPAELIEHFDLIHIEPMEDGYHLFLDQRNIPPAEFSDHRLESKGFLDQAIIRDFPLRGKACFLHLRRRKWHDHDTGQSVCSSWSTVAEGTRLTAEFAAFLKGFDR
ncbi:MAG: transposase [Pedobacter sp.]|nr:MAG: transposase [Pedobacter sp.]